MTTEDREQLQIIATRLEEVCRRLASLERAMVLRLTMDANAIGRRVAVETFRHGESNTTREFIP